MKSLLERLAEAKEAERKARKKKLKKKYEKLRRIRLKDSPEHKRKLAEYQKDYTKRNKDNPIFKEKRLLNSRKQHAKFYNITFEEYLRLKEGPCALCNTITSSSKNGEFWVDHCHETNRVRGPLCPRCNIAIGAVDWLLRDNMLDVAVKYASMHLGKR